jgi:NAD(P)-dependent dehydrogenase (short-subunit alcohol dehydrogenase family)
MRGLTDKIALVTGAGSGIGQATAVRFAQEGAAVAVLDMNPDAASATVEEIERGGGRATAVVCDVTQADEVARAIDETGEALGGLDILVNSVSFAPRKSLADIEPDDWYRTIDGCLNSYFLCIKLALPALKASGGGKIVNVCSIAAHTGYGVPAYTAAKGGILALTRQLAGELATDRINVNSVSPGVVETGINRDTLADPRIRERTVSLTPWGRLGRPEDIAAPIVFLCSADADYITGADLVVDGAMSSTIAWGDIADRFRSFHAQGR